MLTVVHLCILETETIFYCDYLNKKNSESNVN